jgi:hypothetical protein
MGLWRVGCMVRAGAWGGAGYGIGHVQPAGWHACLDGSLPATQRNRFGLPRTRSRAATKHQEMPQRGRALRVARKQPDSLRPT